MFRSIDDPNDWFIVESELLTEDKVFISRVTSHGTVRPFDRKECAIVDAQIVVYLTWMDTEDPGALLMMIERPHGFAPLGKQSHEKICNHLVCNMNNIHETLVPELVDPIVQAVQDEFLIWH